MGNMLANGSRVSDEDSSESDDVKIDESESIEDYVMSEVSSLRDNFEEDEEEEENGFHVGDFVWVEEVKSQQWWPGQIYDSSKASDLALKTMQKGKLLVACFGDRSDFAWCNPLELKPFLENFKEFSKMSDPKSVEEAVREIGEHVEKFLVCDDEAAALVSSVAVNSGIKESVVVPDVRREIVSSLVLENHPGLVLEDVKSLAKSVCFSDLLKIEVLKRKISVFYRCKGRFDLAKFDEHRYIIGLENKEDESCQRFLRKCSKKKRKFGFGDDVATTTGSTTTRWRRLSEVSRIETTEEEISNGKSSSSRKRKNKSGLDEDEIEKREESNDSNHLEEIEKKDEIDVDLATPLASVCKRLRVDVSSSVEKNNRNGESIPQRSKRERKKSKYLSPEYMTDFSLRSRKIKVESAESSQIRVSERMTTEKAFGFVRLGATPEEILSLIRAAALTIQYPQDCNSSCDMVREFVSIYRSFTYHDGTNNKIHKRNISDEEKQPEVKQEVVDEQAETRNESNETVSGVELFIKTGFGSTLPSKDDLIQIYKKFGALDMDRSYIFDNNSCARIVFLNVSDGEEAYNKSLEKYPFVNNTSTITLKLKYLSSEKKETEETRKSVMQIECLKEKLEEIRALLDQSEGKITEELKMKLEDESRNLLDKVSKMIVPLS